MHRIPFCCSSNTLANGNFTSRSSNGLSNFKQLDYNHNYETMIAESSAKFELLSKRLISIFKLSEWFQMVSNGFERF